MTLFNDLCPYILTPGLLLSMKKNFRRDFQLFDIIDIGEGDAYSNK